MIPPAPQARLFPLKVINYALAGNHKFKPQQGHESRNSIVSTPKTLRVCVRVCVDALDAGMVCVGGILLLSWMHCFVPFHFHLGWFWSKQRKHSCGKTLFVSLAKGRQCGSMWRISRRAPDGVWTYSVLSKREWEEVVLGNVQHIDNLLAKVKVDGLFPLYPAHPAGFWMQWSVLHLAPINICL